MLNKIAIVVIVLALAWGLEQVVSSPLETGSVYPQYSSMRSDPTGGMALYESLAKMMTVERLYKSRATIESGRGTTIFILGIDPDSWSKIDDKAIDEYDRLTAKGLRIVIAFLPGEVYGDKSKGSVEERWDIHFNYKQTHAEVGELPHQSGVRLKGGPAWKVINFSSNALERPFGKGSVVLVGNSYPLSNEGLRELHDAPLIASIAGSADKIIFDENHFGVTETGSIAKLMRKYHLEGAVAVLAIVAALFLWRSASSLLPSRAPRAEQAVAGRDSLDGMTALLRRGIAEQDVVRVCYDEWKKTSRDSKESPPEMQNKNVVAAYKTLMEKL